MTEIERTIKDAANAALDSDMWQPRSRQKRMESALSSLGIPLETLAALKAGRMIAVEKAKEEGWLP